MSQQGQLIRLQRTGRDGKPLWAYRYRLGGRDSKRVQRGGFASEPDAAEALERELERVRRERRVSKSLTLAALVQVYLAQHDVEDVTIEKLRWLLGKARGVQKFDSCRGKFVFVDEAAEQVAAVYMKSLWSRLCLER
jgi:hypothetical protein